ncbi:MAG: hypothetical protein R2852_02345 [Bacteroidia bacterium]
MISKSMALGLFLCFSILQLHSQILTKEDSLAAGLQMSGKTTVISGYGECMVSYNNGLQTANASVTRFVTFFGHRFSKNITLFSELELENAKVSSNSLGGEFSLEQMFLKFDLNRSNYIVAGLFLPRIGMINENHLPTTYNGNNRHFVETYLLPATWREIGVGLYGKFDRLPGFNYYVGITNGLNSGGLQRKSGIRDARFEGNNSTASNIALSAAGLYYIRDFRIQASAYYGGSTGVNPKQADSLQLNSGLFGTPVALTEMNVQYQGDRLGFKVLGTLVSIPDAQAINLAYASNPAELMGGALAEVSYQVLDTKDFRSKKLILFGRYEWFDLNYKMPVNGIRDNSLNQQFLIAGINYKPAVGVSIKADVVNQITGTPNEAFNLNPFPALPRYFQNNWFVNLGFGYNF